MSYQKLTAIGFLGRDPEYKTTQNGISVCNFSIACSEKFMVNSEWKEKTEWLNILTFKVLADNCHKYLKKGSQVFIEGKLQTSKWEKDGVTKYKTEILANVVQFLDSKKSAGSHKGEQEQSFNQPKQNEEPYDEESIPF